MGGRSDRDMEQVLRGGACSNLSHKAALRKRLFDETTLLTIEDLEGVTGGVTTEIPKFEEWPDEPLQP